MVPEDIYEKYGMVPKIVFPSGALVNKNNLDIYYGGADTVVCRASTDLPRLLMTTTRNQMTKVEKQTRNRQRKVLVIALAILAVAFFIAAVWPQSG